MIVDVEKKGQGIVEYALILAFVVAVGGVLYANGNLADSIRSVFSNVNTLIEEASKPPLEVATTAQDIIERLRQGRYDGLAAEYQNHSTVRIAEGLFNSMGKSAVSSGQTYFPNTKGYVGLSPSGNGIIIDPTPIDRIK